MAAVAGAGAGAGSEGAQSAVAAIDGGMTGRPQPPPPPVLPSRPPASPSAQVSSGGTETGYTASSQAVAGLPERKPSPSALRTESAPVESVSSPQEMKGEIPQPEPEPEPEAGHEGAVAQGQPEAALPSPPRLYDATATRRQFDEARRNLLETVSPGAVAGTGLGSQAAASAAPDVATPVALSTGTPLVTIDPDGKLTVPDRALVMLREVEDDVAVVAVAGAARGGKSFLLNCLAAAREQPLEGPPPVRFTVGPNVAPCTLGLWAWMSPESVEVADGQRMRILFVDSEGLGAIKSAEQKDMNILALALLLSSTFIFNSTGAIDERSIGKLAFVTKLSRHVRINLDGSDDAADFERSFPNFLWVLRDFSLTLRDSTGGSLSEKQYLERALQPERGLGDAVAERNRLRMLLTTFFPRRDCCTLPRPLTAESALSQMGAVDVDSHVQFRDGFTAALARLRSQLFQGLRPKRLHGSALKGASLAILLTEYVGAMNSGQVPTIARGWEAVQQAQSLKAVKSAIQCFKATMSVSADGAALEYPMSPEVLRKRYDTALAEAKRVLSAGLLDPDDSSTHELVAKVQSSCDAVFELCKEHNSAALQKQLRAVLTKGWESTHDKVVARDARVTVAAVIADWRALVRMVDAREGAGGQQEALTAAHAFLSETVLADILAVSSQRDESAEEAVLSARAAEQNAQETARHAQEDAALKLQEAATSSRAMVDEIQRKLDSALETARAAESRAAAVEQGRLNAVAAQENLSRQLEDAAARVRAAEKQAEDLRRELSSMTVKAQEALINVTTWQARCEKEAEISALKIQNAMTAAEETKARLTEAFAERATLQATVAEEQRVRRAAEQNAAAAERQVLEAQLREERAMRRFAEVGGGTGNGGDRSSSVAGGKASPALPIANAPAATLGSAEVDEVVTLPPRTGRRGSMVRNPASDNRNIAPAPLPVRKRG